MGTTNPPAQPRPLADLVHLAVQIAQVRDAFEKTDEAYGNRGFLRYTPDEDAVKGPWLNDATGGYEELRESYTEHLATWLAKRGKQLIEDVQSALITATVSDDVLSIRASYVGTLEEGGREVAKLSYAQGRRLAVTAIRVWTERVTTLADGVLRAWDGRATAPRINSDQSRGLEKGRHFTYDQKVEVVQRWLDSERDAPHLAEHERYKALHTALSSAAGGQAPSLRSLEGWLGAHMENALREAMVKA